MRILVIPMITSPTVNINSDGDFRVCRLLARSFWRAGLDVFFYILLPKKSEGHVKVWEGDNYKILFEDESLGQSIYEQTVPPLEVWKKFDVVSGDYPIDCIVSERTWANGTFRRMSLDRCGRELPVFTFESKVLAAEQSENHNILHDIDMSARVFGYSTCYNMFATKAELVYALECMKRYSSPYVIKRFLDQSVVIPFELEMDDIDRITKDEKKAENFTLFWTGRMNTNKNWDKAVDLFDKFFCIGNNVEILLNSPLVPADSLGDVLKGKNITYTGGNLDREKYVRCLCRSHVGVSFSDIEGFTIGVIEQVMCGMVVLLPYDRTWARALFADAEKDYKYFYKDFAHAYVLLKQIYGNYEKAYADMEPVRKYVSENYRDLVVSKRRMEFIKKRCAEFYRDKVEYKISRGWMDLVLESATALGSGFNFADLIKKLKEKAEWGELVGKRANKPIYVGTNEIYRFLVENGYKDMCNSETPVFVKL